MRPHGSPEDLERRRRRGVALLKQGESPAEAARRLNCSHSSVARWQKAFAQGGSKALAAKPVPGRPRKLDDQERQRLWAILLEGAVAHGFPNELWTLKRICQVIRRELGVRYHPGHLWRILRASIWSCQVPERRAIQRKEDAIRHWKRYRWPHIKKGSTTRRPPRLP